MVPEGFTSIQCYNFDTLQLLGDAQEILQNSCVGVCTFFPSDVRRVPFMPMRGRAAQQVSKKRLKRVPRICDKVHLVLKIAKVPEGFGSSATSSILCHY